MGAFSSVFAARLERISITGTFEAHLTVDTTQREEFAALCAELGVDHVGIELPRGTHRAQPMTASYHRGALPAVAAEVEALHARLVARGFAVVRVKLEALAANEGVPVVDGSSEGYFEFHVKVRLCDDAALALLAEVAEQHGARLSRNDRRRDTDGTQRFVTLRVYRLGRPSADAKLDALVAALTAAGFELAGTAREYTVYDSRIDLDAGWLEPP